VWPPTATNWFQSNLAAFWLQQFKITKKKWNSIEIELRLFELSNIVIIAVLFFSKIRTNETIVKRKQNKNEENVVGNGIVASITETWKNWNYWKEKQWPADCSNAGGWAPPMEAHQRRHRKGDAHQIATFQNFGRTAQSILSWENGNDKSVKSQTHRTCVDYYLQESNYNWTIKEWWSGRIWFFFWILVWKLNIVYSSSFWLFSMGKDYTAQGKKWKDKFIN